MNHWLSVGADIFMVIKWILPAISTLLILFAVVDADVDRGIKFRNYLTFWFGIILYIFSICQIGGLL